MWDLWRDYFCILSMGVVIAVQQLVVYLPILLVIAFPMLYYGGQSSNSLCSIAGILVLLLGMAGPLIKRALK